MFPTKKFNSILEMIFISTTDLKSRWLMQPNSGQEGFKDEIAFELSPRRSLPDKQ
jgi:hypothetical protein